MAQRSVRQPPKGDDWREDWKEAGVLASSAAQRRAIIKAGLDGICAACGVRVLKWHADHAVALHTITPSQLADYPSVLRFWAVGNLQCLGVDCGCHQKKTNLERSSNAKVLRIVKKSAANREKSITSGIYKKQAPKFRIPAQVMRKRRAFAAQQRERARAWRKAQRDRLKTQKKGPRLSPRPHSTPSTRYF